MLVAAALPLALHPSARRVANIGFGSGMTTHGLLAAPALERVDSVQIEPAVIDAARFFGALSARATKIRGAGSIPFVAPVPCQSRTDSVAAISDRYGSSTEPRAPLTGLRPA